MRGEKEAKGSCVETCGTNVALSLIFVTGYHFEIDSF